MAQVAESFHVLPTVAARELDRDAGLNMECLLLLRYAEMFGVYERGNKDEIKRHADSPLMGQVILNAHALAEAQIAEG